MNEDEVDITERTGTQKALRESEERFRLAAQAGRMFAYSWDAATDVIERSGESATILGIDEAESLTGYQAISRVHPDDRERLLAAMAALGPKKPFLQVIYRIVRPDESVIWVERHSRAFFDEHGKLARIVGMIVDITERRRAEEALLRHAAIVESSDEAIISTDLNGTVSDWNKGAEQLFGYSAKEAIGMNISCLSATDRPHDGLDVLRKALKGEVVRNYETVRLRKDGRLIEVSLTVFPIVNAEGQTVGASGFGRDITERKLAERELRQTNERLNLTMEAGRIGCWEANIKDGTSFWFGRTHAILGITRQIHSPSAGRFWECVHQEDRAWLQAAVQKAMWDHTELTVEFRVVWPDGSLHWLRTQGRFFYGADGQAERMLGISEDITEAKSVEEALRQSEEKFLKAFRGSPVAITLSRAKDRRFIDVNDTFERVTGYSREEVIGSTAWDIGLWVDPSQREELTRRLLSERSIKDLELRFRIKNGGVIVCSVSAALIEVGKELCILSVASDMTQRKLAEEALRVSEERLRMGQWAAHIGTFDLNFQTGADIWTPEMEALYGLPPGGFAGTLAAFEDLVHPDDRGRIVALTREMVRTGQPAEEEWRAVWPDGSVHWIAGRAQVFMDESGKPSRMLGVNIDVTERKQAEAALSGMTRKLVEAQEQERIRIARELHDDISQRLALLAIELDQLREKHADLPTEVRDHMQGLQQMTADISSRVYSMSHELHSLTPDPSNLAKAMRGWCREFGKRQKMEIIFSCDDLPRVPQAVSLCLFRVLQEALHNSAKHSGVNRVAVQLAENSGEIHLTVSDAGKGCDLEAARQSQGLGLTSMQERVRLVGGTIEIDSKPLAGTAIHVSVPFR
jgi:PAS domain S-box-containing protein